MQYEATVGIPSGRCLASRHLSHNRLAANRGTKFVVLTDQLHFKSIEFWIRQAAEEIDAMGNLGCNLKEAVPDLLRLALEPKWIRRMPVRDNRLTRPSWSPFFGLIANGNYEVKMLVPKLVPGFAASFTRANLVILLEDQKGHRVYLPGGIRTGAVNLETVTSLLTKKVLSENASRRITVAKNEYFVRTVGVHELEQHEATAFLTIRQ